MECRSCFEITDQEFSLCNSCERKKKSSKFWMILGLALTLLGIVGSISSYFSAINNINNSYTIYYGFVIFSFIVFIKSFADWLYYRKREKEIKQHGNLNNNNNGDINEDALKRYLNNRKND